MSSEPDREGEDEIAIIGMAGRFPSARSVDEFWINVRDGIEGIRRLSDEELIAAGVPRNQLSDPNYVKACPTLDDIDKFDAGFFGFSPRDASVMDPAQRFFLEVAWQAMEHAGYTGLPEQSAVGVFAGTGAPLYMIENLRTNPELMRSMGEFLVRHTGNDMNFMATRVSYEMDLRGPSINVQTACSSALVAVHLACQSLSRGECNLALAGGSTILVPMGQGYAYHEGEILSPDGHCRPFDEKSAGTVFGSGTGAVVLKRLKDALDDGDTIHAVIKGSAINNDGSLKVGYLAPSVDGQADVIDAALRKARVAAESISYVEAHGTGTLVGDPIEVEGLRQAFARQTDKKQFCALGSVKSNIGHLGEAAGIASLIKAVLALKHRKLPPSLGYDAPNPQIDFLNSPFFVNRTLRDWHSEGPRRCGVTALGAGGTNCHVILEEPPEPIEGEGARALQLLVVSAKSRSALDRACDNLAEHLTGESVDLADAAYTLALGRRTMPHRRVLVASTRAEAAARLRERDPKFVLTAQHDGPAPKVAFLFPGGGAQYAGMGAELYELEDVYREAIDECLAITEPALGLDLRALMFAPAEQREQATRMLERPSLTLPSLFATSYALAKLFQAWGVDPVAYVGHSMGEYVAALLAEVVTLDEALRLVMLRGRLFEQVAPGGMLSVALPEAELRTWMPAGLSIAAVNGPDLCVASGPLSLIESLERALEAKEIEHTRVRINVAAHSSMLDPILAEFEKLCRTIAWQAPKLPFVSNLTGRFITAGEATDPGYWVKHLRNTVRFGDCMETVLGSGARVVLELGPGRTLSTLARAQRTQVHGSFNTMRHPQEAASDLGYALMALGRLFLAGVELDWAGLYDGQLRNRVPLPSYPFEHKSFWVAPGTAVSSTGITELGKRENIDEWFATPAWTQAPLLEPAPPLGDATVPTRWLVFSDGSKLAKRLIERLGSETLVVTAGSAVKRVGARQFELDLSSSNQHHDLLDALVEADLRPDHVVYVLAHASERPRLRRRSLRAHDEELARQLDESFFTPTFIARALGGLGEPVQLSVVTTGLTGLSDEPLAPIHATVVGPVLVAAREFLQLDTRCIDVPREPLGLLATGVEDDLVRELAAASDARLVALRPNARWVQGISKLNVPPVPEGAASRGWLREGGVYVLTGGLGGIALEVAMHFAKHKRVKLALLGRSELPPEREWDTILLRGHAASLGAQRIQKVRALRELGAEVQILACDIADYASTERAFARVRAELGPIAGVVHAAGVMDDEPMESRTVTAMQRVLEPKVRGTLVLDALVSEPLDFFLLFSSVASSLGLPGQVDYTAANAFLDAFARERSRRAAGHTVVVNWNAWREVGMAALSHQMQQRGPLPSTPCTHPALDGYSDDRATGRVFSTDFQVERQWLLSEHRIRGSLSLLSGTTFVELARAAFSVGRAPGPVEITDLSFVSPFQVRPGETRRLSIQLAPAGDAHEIVMRTAGADARMPPHVIGDVRVYRGPRPPAIELVAVAARCHLCDTAPSDGFLQQAFVEFGPRWANIKRIRYGVSEALIELQLPRAFEPDLEHYALHPALLDMATGGAQPLIPGFDQARDFFVPVGYGRVRVFAPMPAHLFSHVRCRPETGAGVACFDVTLTDAEGRPFAEITRFEMKRLETSSLLTSAQHVAASARVSHGGATSVLESLLREAIAPHEGVLALDRIMAQPQLVQCIASSVDVHAWQAQLDAVGREVSTSGADEADQTGFSRPDLSCDFEAPGSASEQKLAQIWSELLGVRQIGVHDDFFELGGNSLVAVRLFAAIKKKYGVSLPLSTLFEAPSIRPLAELLDANAPRSTAEPTSASNGASDRSSARESERPSKQTYSSIVPMQVNGDRPPFYCAAGMGGNPLNLRSLALLVGMDQPFFGLQPQGLDGSSPLHSSVTEMAAYYVSQIKAKQPEGPYYLGGYSGGGVIAFEMAKQLAGAGEEVGALVFIDSLAPVLPGRSRAERMQIHLSRFREEGLAYVSETAARRLESELRTVTARLRRPVAKLFPYHFRLENIADTWVDAASRYRPEPYDGDAALFRASELSPLIAGTAIKLDDSNGWAPYVRGGIEVSACPGDHHNMCEQPNVRVLARRLRSYLDRRIGERQARANLLGQLADPSHEAATGTAHPSRRASDAA